ncbi:MAG: radical SAM family heme chaperone HemW [Sphingomonadales bacterium]
MSKTTDAFGLYIHWPFCAAKCPYCDFNSHVRDSIDQAAWRNALLQDLEHAAELAGPRGLSSIFFGGGTPSLMDPQTVEALIDRAHALFPTQGAVEITLEANPSSVEAANFKALATAGVNRVSLGIQSFNDEALRFLGRLHNADEALKALDTAQNEFARVSFDLIYTRPNQSLEDWAQELDRALGFGTEHLSLYQLTIEPGTAFYTKARLGQLDMPDEDLSAALFDFTQERMADAGLPAYEISNHARPGCESRHNLIYWRGQSYAGIGPGAHGRLQLSDGWVASEAQRLPEKYMQTIEDQGHGLKPLTPIDDNERAKEMLMMGLRLKEGVDLRTLPAEVIDTSGLEQMIDLGFLSRNQQRLCLTTSGWPLLNPILEKIIN